MNLAFKVTNCHQFDTLNARIMGEMGCRQTVPALISLFCVNFLDDSRVDPQITHFGDPHAFEDPWSKTRWFMHLKTLIRVQVVTYFGARASRGVCVTFNIKSVL